MFDKLFKKSKVASNEVKSKDDDGLPTSPYLAARREWLERYGEYVNQAKNWRIAAIIAMLLALFMGVGLFFTAKRVRVIPYVVYLNKSGNLRDIKILQPIPGGISPYIIRYKISQFIVDAFGSTGSMVGNKEHLIKVSNESNTKTAGVIALYIKEHKNDIKKDVMLVNVSYILQKGNSNVYSTEYTVTTILVGPLSA